MDPETHAAIQARLVRVRGQVQGVGYRYSCVQQAGVLGVAGWVRNCSDGSVEALLEGTPARVQAMCDWMRHDVPGARVESMDIVDAAPSGEKAEGFRQRPTQ